MYALTYSRAATKTRARAVKVQQTPMIMGPLLSVMVTSKQCCRTNVKSKVLSPRNKERKGMEMEKEKGERPKKQVSKQANKESRIWQALYSHHVDHRVNLLFCSREV
jgi:hypothetical protein